MGVGAIGTCALNKTKGLWMQAKTNELHTHYHTDIACSLNPRRLYEHPFNHQECAKAHQGLRFQSALCQVRINHRRKDNAQA
jgi:hypothetical protein